METGTVTLDLKIRQGLTTLVSESMTSGALIYNAMAWDAIDDVSFGDTLLARQWPHTNLKPSRVPNRSGPC